MLVALEGGEHVFVVPFVWGPLSLKATTSEKVCFVAVSVFDCGISGRSTSTKINCSEFCSLSPFPCREENPHPWGGTMVALGGCWDTMCIQGSLFPA